MKIDVTMQQIFLNNAMYSQVVRRVRFALSRFGTYLQIVKVRITDINGPKGGMDKRCVVYAKLASSGDVVVQGEGENIFSALSDSLSRAGRSINRSLERRRDIPIRMNR
ncbi:MAG: HPF/RaiA family ribosome-associated protein [Pseudomonadota bacterium]